MASSARQHVSMLNAKTCLTVSECIKGLLNFASTILPLFIYATIPPEKGQDEITVTREIILGITASLYIIQVQLPRNCNADISNVSIIRESLVQSLARCVLLYSEIEASLKVDGRTHLPPRISPRKILAESFKKSKIRNKVSELEGIDIVLGTVVDVVTCQDVNAMKHLEQEMSERMKSMLGKTQGLSTQVGKVSPESAQDESLGSILELVVPISHPDIFNCAQYTSTAVGGFTEDSPAITYLAQVSKVYWELPWPNTLEKRAGQLQLPDTAGIWKYLANFRAKGHEDNEPKEERVILLTGRAGDLNVLRKRIDLCLRQSRGLNKECCSEVFNYLVYELELGSRAASKKGFEISESNAWALYICAQHRIGSEDAIPRNCLPSFINLWADRQIKTTLRRKHGGKVFGNFVHFYKDITRLFLKHYIPTRMDMQSLSSFSMLRNDLVLDIESTTYRFLFETRFFHLLRRKSRHPMIDLKAIVFVSDLGEYDHCLIEQSSHQMVPDRRSLAINHDMLDFQAVITADYYKDVEILLLFTNVDWFCEKIEAGERPIKQWFPEYQGHDLDADQGMDFFTDLYMRMNANSERVPTVEYTHERDANLLRKIHRGINVARSLRGSSPANLK